MNLLQRRWQTLQRLPSMTAVVRKSAELAPLRGVTESKQTELYPTRFERQCRLVGKRDLVDENIWKCERLGPVCCSTSHLRYPPKPPGHFPQPESAGFAVSPSPLIATVRGSLHIQATIKSPLRYLDELTFL